MFVVGALVFALGLIVGSFLNVVVERLPKEGSLLGRSRCPKCGCVLKWRNLVPLLSFFLLRGKCRNCQRAISWRYPAVEAATGGLFAAVYYTGAAGRLAAGGGWWRPAAYGYLLLITSALMVIFVLDLRDGIIPDKIVAPAVLLAIGYRLAAVGFRVGRLRRELQSDAGGLGPYLLRTSYFRNHVFLEVKPFLLTLLGSFLISLFFYFLIVVTRGRGMGWGDVKLGFLVGLVSGFPRMLAAFFLSFLTGALASVILILMRKKHFGETVPFGPFLVLGTLAALLFGDWALWVF